LQNTKLIMGRKRKCG